jgi:glycosyltransferase involved in cell wall biosynthesis
MTKVLFVIPNLTSGGIQTQVLLLAKHFKNHLKMDVTIWGAVSSQKSFTDVLDSEGIHYELHPEIMGFFARPYLDANKFGKLKMWGKLWFNIVKGRYKVILPYTVKVDFIFNIVWQFTTAKACFSFERGGHPTPKPKPIQNDIYHKLARKPAPVYVANSYHGKKALSVMRTIPEDKIHVIRNAYIPKTNNSEESWERYLPRLRQSVTITMIANFFGEKDHLTVLKAWQNIKGKYQNAVLVFAGMGGPKNCIENFHKTQIIVKKMRLGDSVIFTGSIHNTKKLLEASDIGLLSTISEGCPNAVLEYMGAGLPIIGTDIPGIREIIHPENHKFLFPVGDVEQGTDRLEKLIDSSELRSELGSKNRTYVNENFAPDNMYKAYYNILKEKKILK